MSTPTLYHVDQHGALRGEASLARCSPSDADEVQLIPEHGTSEGPPTAGERGVAAVLSACKWSIIADHCCLLAYDTVAQTTRVSEMPGPLGVGETLTPGPSPRHRWAAGGWVLPLADAKAEDAIEAAAEAEALAAIDIISGRN